MQSDFVEVAVRMTLLRLHTTTADALSPRRRRRKLLNFGTFVDILSTIFYYLRFIPTE